MHPKELKDRQDTVTEASESSFAHLTAQHGMRALSRRLNEALRPVGITSAQFCLLSILYQGDPPTVKEMADQIKMDRTHVSAQISLLVRRNLVVSATPRGARYHRRLTLTAHGMTTLMDALPLWQKAEADTRDLFDHVDLEYLSTLAVREAQLEETAGNSRYEDERLLVLDSRD
jgi:DNA-binding MarR family transcriptional regulator